MRTTFENRLACVISATGEIVHSYLVDNCQFDGVNEYVITWGVPLQGAAKTDFSATIGSVTDETVAPGLITVGLGETDNQLKVHTFDAHANPVASSFHIACFRDQ